MSRIKVMSQTLANMIAAGEVIERPSSVIKELVENSIDAKASYIQVYVENAGKKSIIVKDDGIGMDDKDALLAFKRHASSKLTSIYDLPRIATLGFRGEAVPSIASISHVLMKTSDGNIGSIVESDPDKGLSLKKGDLEKGTTFEVKELFFNTPARLKYLKSDKTETQACIDVVTHLALGFPSIAFSMYVDNSLVINTTGRGDLLEVISLLYGTNIAKNVLPFTLNGDGFSGSGYVVHPSFSYSNRYNILTFLNNRSVYIPKVNKAIIDAYKDYLPPNRYPLTFIDFDVDYSLVDVNVHPAKKEVRLSCEDILSKMVYQQVLVSLSKTRASFDQVDIPDVSVSSFVNKKVEPLNASSFTSNSLQPNKENLPKLDLGLDDISNTSLLKEKPTDNISFFDSHGYKEDNTVSQTISVSTNKIVQQTSNFPKLVPIGQVLQTYIVCDSDDGMYLIDQHAAAERINFEKCEDEFNSNLSLQIPLIPIVINLTPSTFVNYDQNHIDMLKKIGIVTSYFGPNSIKVDEIVSSLVGKGNEGLVNDIIVQTLNDRDISIKEVKRLAIATKACKMSIKANHMLTKELMLTLIDNLSKCRNPLNCPHGRPTVIKISKYEIEKLFKRTGF